ncbi:hypothetical protein LEP1GSC070_0481 [Leptospira santarosai str. AIM]|nr:hypothetical protein LEP1GSC070_0481 [Leptospira santarosai str. AIM]
MKVEEENLEAVVKRQKKQRRIHPQKFTLEEKASEWLEMQETTPRPGSSYKKQYIPKGVSLNPIVKMVKPESLRPNPRNDFDPLTEEEYASLKREHCTQWESWMHLPQEKTGHL